MSGKLQYSLQTVQAGTEFSYTLLFLTLYSITFALCILYSYFFTLEKDD